MKIIAVTKTTSGSGKVSIQKAVAIANDEAQALELIGWSGGADIIIEVEVVGESNLEPRLLSKEKLPPITSA